MIFHHNGLTEQKKIDLSTNESKAVGAQHCNLFVSICRLKIQDQNVRIHIYHFAHKMSAHSPSFIVRMGDIFRNRLRFSHIAL